MGLIQGTVSLDPAADGIALSVDGSPVATFAEPEQAVEGDHLTVHLDGGERWTVRGSVPSLLAAALESDTAPSVTTLTPPLIPEWPSAIAADSGTLASAETGVSPMTYAPVTSTIQSGGAVYTLIAGPSWNSWTLGSGEGTLASLDTADAITAAVDRPVPLPVLVLSLATALGVAAETQRPGFLTAKRRERKVEEKFLKKYADTIAAAHQAGHEAQYMSAWDDGRNFQSWVECLTCGDRASTFEGMGGTFVSSMGFGKALGQLKGSMLDEPCPGRRKI